MLLVDSGTYELQGKFVSFLVIRAENLIMMRYNIKWCISAAIAPS